MGDNLAEIIPTENSEGLKSKMNNANNSDIEDILKQYEELNETYNEILEKIKTKKKSKLKK